MELETNLIYCGDNLEVLAKFPEKSVDLIYADPPFFSNKHYEIIWGNGAEMKVYEDRWKGGINVYIEWMQERLWQCYRVLKDTGSMYLHCDWHASHRLRVAMDDLFGYKNFQNEIVWAYQIGGKSHHKWGRKHDVILFYTKGKDYIFNANKVRMPRKAGTHMKIEYGSNGMPVQVKVSKTGKTYTYPVHEGKLPDDVWTDIQQLNREDKERLGYPTQKPEALLKRIIEASSNKGDIVLDPFCGGGTTIAVAHQLGRKWIGIDVSPIACNKMKARLEKAGVTNIRIMGAPKTVEELKQLSDWQFQNWVIDRIGGVPSSKKADDKGVDGYTFMAREPVQVKQSEDIGRNVVDNFETAMRRKHKAIGYIVAFSFGKGAYEEAARAKLEDNLDIKLVRVDEMDKYF
jgi:DNA modification methylase